eukprot:9360389-Pyramimonas_sp.AAC.1
MSRSSRGVPDRAVMFMSRSRCHMNTNVMRRDYNVTPPHAPRGGGASGESFEPLREAPASAGQQ